MKPLVMRKITYVANAERTIGLCERRRYAITNHVSTLGVVFVVESIDSCDAVSFDQSDTQI